MLTLTEASHQSSTPGRNVSPSHLARCGLTCAGLKGDISAAGAVVLMGIHPQTVLGAFNQIRHSNGRLLFHPYGFHYLVTALETQERCQSHSRGGGLAATVTGCAY